MHTPFLAQFSSSSCATPPPTCSVLPRRGMGGGGLHPNVGPAAVSQCVVSQCLSLSLSPSVCQSACLSVSIYVTSAPCAILARTKLPAKAKDARLLLLPPPASSLPLAPSLRWMDFWIRNLHLDYKSDFDAYMRCTSYTYTIYIYIYISKDVCVFVRQLPTPPPLPSLLYGSTTHTRGKGVR